MSPFQLTPEAIEDLDSIWCLSRPTIRKPPARVEIEIVAECGVLSRTPSIGHKRRDITPLPVRFWTLSKYPNYVIVYRPETKSLQVVAILHGKQNAQSILQNRSV